DASEFARRVGSAAQLRKALTFQGILLADTGNLPGAIECLAEALELATELKDLRAEASVWNNLGAAFIYAGQFFEAIGCMERVISLADQETSAAELRAYALANIALACLHIEDFGRGLRAAKSAVEGAEEPKTPAQLHQRVLTENYYTR